MMLKWLYAWESAFKHLLPGRFVGVPVKTGRIQAVDILGVEAAALIVFTL
jgi:hypothetical protein